MKIRKAIIPVAGFGTRLLPITKALPKALLPIVDKPSIHYLVEEAVASGIEEVIIVTGQDREGIENYFNRSKDLEKQLLKSGKHELLGEIQKISSLAQITYAIQSKTLGLGHAIACAQEYVGRGEPFAVLLGDDLVISQEPCIMQLIKEAQLYKASIIGVQPVAQEEVSQYGIIKGESVSPNLLKLEDLIEKPNHKIAPSNLAIMGRYIIDYQIFDILKQTPLGKGGEIQLTDALRVLNKTQDVYALVFQGTRYDVGNKLGYLKANLDFAWQREDLKEGLQIHINKLK